MMPRTKYKPKLPRTNSPSLAVSHRPRRDVPTPSSNLTSLSFGDVTMVSVQCAYMKGARIVSALFALFLIFLSAPRSWAAADALDASAPDVPTAVPTLVQHVATGMDRYPMNALTIQLP